MYVYDCTTSCGLEHIIYENVDMCNHTYVHLVILTVESKHKFTYIYIYIYILMYGNMYLYVCSLTSHIVHHYYLFICHNVKSNLYLKNVI